MSQTGFWWILLAWALYGALHTLLASFSAKALAERRLGLGVRRYYRLFYNLAVSLTLLPLLALVVLSPDLEISRITFPWLALTLAIEGLAALGLLYGVLQTGALQFLGLAQLSAPPGSGEPPKLVVSGLYRYVRHPLYLFGLLILWLLPLMTWNILAFNLGATAYILIGIQFEERKMLKEFGQAYADYQRCVPMLLPWTKFHRR
ncbi:MAG: methyltransferase [Anaerolineaceae bacterium]|jgi:protein-S-isoprenylcysteine O-methyltransferase Ste14